MPRQPSERKIFLAPRTVLAIAAVLVCLKNPAVAIEPVNPGVPSGWKIGSNAPNLYSVGIDPSVQHNGARSAYITTATDGVTADHWAALLQNFDAGAYRGKRLALTAYVKSEDVAGWAGLLMRVDGPAMGTLRFDNMKSRPIKGTTDWQGYQVVLDVPDDATDIAIGLLLEGAGKVWVSGFAVAATTASPTSRATPTPLPTFEPGPQNLDFML